MDTRPAYFEAVRQRSVKLWELPPGYEAYASIRSLLFSQIQHPQHVLSELLQNAADADATKAEVELDGQGYFIFKHNGNDFTETQFDALCKFGFSTKSNLHTIGFRGIGFKSTFSFGDMVEVFTKSISIAFDKQRFIEPRWIESSFPDDGWTRIRIKVEDQIRLKEIERDLAKWEKDPLSLLFFDKLHNLAIGCERLEWTEVRPGPVPNSSWMRLEGRNEDPILLIRSELEEFPTDAIDEIRRERRFNDESETAFPPCRVDILLAPGGRLFISLPTSTKTSLPYCFNAPFMPAPDRVDLKSPAMSPTNRWLLERVGKLAGETMLSWLRNEALSLEDRAYAYHLISNIKSNLETISDQCGKLVEDAFNKCIENQPILLTEDGRLVGIGEAICLPKIAYKVWNHENAVAFLDVRQRPALCSSIGSGELKIMKDRKLVDEVDYKQFVTSLATAYPPKPASWDKLLLLWDYVYKEFSDSEPILDATKLNILPVKEVDVLHSGMKVVSPKPKPGKMNQEDWDYVLNYFHILDEGWVKYISSQEILDGLSKIRILNEENYSHDLILDKLKLRNQTHIKKLIESKADLLFDKIPVTIREYVRTAHIAAALEVKVNNNFYFLTVDEHRHSIEDEILYEEENLLFSNLPPTYLKQHLLHPAYLSDFDSCTFEQWLNWTKSGNSGLIDLPLLKQNDIYYKRYKCDFEEKIRSLGNLPIIFYPYSYDNKYTYQRFSIDDFDFEDILVNHWNNITTTDVWAIIARRLLLGDSARWKDKSIIIAQQSNTNESSWSKIKEINILSAWLRRLKEKPCLPDMDGDFQKPTELSRRRNKLESPTNVPHLIDASLDTPETEGLLKLLGVKEHKLTGVDQNTPAEPEPPPSQKFPNCFQYDSGFNSTTILVDFEKISKIIVQELIKLNENEIEFKVCFNVKCSEEFNEESIQIISNECRALNISNFEFKNN